MKVVIQRAKDAKCTVNNKITGQIDKGYVLLVGFTNDDTIEIVKKVARKIVNLRIFSDNRDKMNLSLKDIDGKILSISQFTLYAKLEGRRPSFTKAMKFEEAKKLYKDFNEELKNLGCNVEEGIFGEDMKISLTNDGPVTIIIDSKYDL